MVWRARSHRRSIKIWWTSLAVWIIHGQRSRRTRPCNLYVPWMNRLFISISVVLVYPRSLSRFALLVLVVGNRDCYQIRYPLFCGLCEAQVCSTPLVLNPEYSTTEVVCDLRAPSLRSNHPRALMALSRRGDLSENSKRGSSSVTTVCTFVGMSVMRPCPSLYQRRRTI